MHIRSDPGKKQFELERVKETARRTVGELRRSIKVVKQKEETQMASIEMDLEVDIPLDIQVDIQLDIQVDIQMDIQVAIQVAIQVDVEPDRLRYG